jgi:hypothetical protein
VYECVCSEVASWRPSSATRYTRTVRGVVRECIWVYMSVYECECVCMSVGG